jgi:hypothetical protein
MVVVMVSEEGTATWYREQAAKLRELAEKAVDPEAQSELLQTARRFDLLAEHADAREGRNHGRKR